MPNWCENTIIVSGPAGELERFKELVRTDEAPFSFERIIPQPENLRDVNHPEDGDQAMPDWYHWRIQTWGTKWDLDDETRFDELDNGDGTTRLQYFFNTAWAPCSPIVANLAERFPALTISHAYDEPGMDFGGFEVYGGGKLTDSNEGGSRSNTWAEMAEWASEV